MRILALILFSLSYAFAIVPFSIPKKVSAADFLKEPVNRGSKQNKDKINN